MYACIQKPNSYKYTAGCAKCQCEHVNVNIDACMSINCRSMCRVDAVIDHILPVLKFSNKGCCIPGLQDYVIYRPLTLRSSPHRHIATPHQLTTLPAAAGGLKKQTATIGTALLTKYRVRMLI
jgi:hypothetical protein